MAKNKKTTTKKKPIVNGIVIDCAFTHLEATESLVPNPRNPHTHSEKQVAILANLIKHHHWRNAITVSRRSGFVVSGHCRLLAAKLLEMKSVPVDFQDFKNDAQEWAVLISDNFVGELSGLDVKILGDGLQWLDELNFPMELTALDKKQIEDFVVGLDEGDDAIVPKNQYDVIVECKDEQEQKTVFEMLKKKGYKCRLLTL